MLIQRKSTKQYKFVLGLRKLKKSKLFCVVSRLKSSGSSCYSISCAFAESLHISHQKSSYSFIKNKLNVSEQVTPDNTCQMTYLLRVWLINIARLLMSEEVVTTQSGL